MNLDSVSFMREARISLSPQPNQDSIQILLLSVVLRPFLVLNRIRVVFLGRTVLIHCRKMVSSSQLRKEGEGRYPVNLRNGFLFHLRLRVPQGPGVKLLRLRLKALDSRPVAEPAPGLARVKSPEILELGVGWNACSRAEGFRLARSEIADTARFLPSPPAPSSKQLIYRY